MDKNKVPDNFYDILEVSPRASMDVIRAAYSTLMKNFHPDKGGSERVAKLLNQAKEVLLDPDKRSDYDKQRLDLTGRVIGNYRFLEKIAEGGFGKTYKGEHVRLKLPVCIKHGHEISPQDEELLMDEARAIWDLRHYGIPAMRDVMKMDDGGLALVMSYVPGKTLEQIVEIVGRLDAENVSWIAERSLNVLKYLHYHGVVHGDVKPQNIIVQPEVHNIVMVDYGLSAIQPRHNDKNRGYTPYFAAPEQVNGSPLVPESDFFGLGVTMIYALGGDIASKKVPSSTPDPLCHFIKRLLVRDVLSRPNWHKEDLVDSMREVREKSFGRKHSGMKPIPGLS